MKVLDILHKIPLKGSVTINGSEDKHKENIRIRKGGIHFYVGVSIFLLAYIFQKIYGDSPFIWMQYLLGLWITVWAMYIGPCFPTWAKYKKWWKTQRSISLIGTSIATIFFLIGIIGKTFFG